MNDKGLRVAVLILSVLEWSELVRLWDSCKVLRKSFYGFTVAMDSRRLLIPSVAVFQSLHRTLWLRDEPAANIAQRLMASDYIEEAAYIVRSFGITHVRTLAEIVIINGRLAALHALPLQDEVSQELSEFGCGLPVSRVSMELFEACNMWARTVHSNSTIKTPKRKELEVAATCYRIVDLVTKAVEAESSIVIDYIAERLRNVVEQHDFYFRKHLGTHLKQLKVQNSIALWWGYAPAQELVKFLLDRANKILEQ